MKVNTNTTLCPIITPDIYGYGFQYDIDDECWDDFKRGVSLVATDYIKDALYELDIPYSNLSVGELKSPRYYNFETDWIDFSFDIPDDYVDEIKYDLVTDDFFNYANSKFGSHSGFHSFYPHTVDKFMESTDQDYIVSMWISYLADQYLNLDSYIDRYQDDFIDSVWDMASQNGYLYYEDDEE